jgi:hypothetical protein
MKPESRHEEVTNLSNSDSHDKQYLADEHVPFTPEEEKKLMRKIDLRLIPWLSFLYLLSFLDRANIGNAVSFAGYLARYAYQKAFARPGGFSWPQ